MRRSSLAPLRLSPDEPLSLFQSILLTTDGTVTELLALYTRRRISVRKLEQAIVLDAVAPELGCDPQTPLLKRRILLGCGQENYLYAESYFVFERLSRSIQYRLLETDIPIGLLWKEERLETFREIVACREELDCTVAKYFDIAPGTPLLSRTYLIYSARKPIGVITEKFPSSCFRRDA